MRIPSKVLRAPFLGGFSRWLYYSSPLSICSLPLQRSRFFSALCHSLRYSAFFKCSKTGDGAFQTANKEPTEPKESLASLSPRVIRICSFPSSLSSVMPSLRVDAAVSLLLTSPDEFCATLFSFVCSFTMPLVRLCFDEYPPATPSTASLRVDSESLETRPALPSRWQFTPNLLSLFSHDATPISPVSLCIHSALRMATSPCYPTYQKPLHPRPVTTPLTLRWSPPTHIVGRSGTTDRIISRQTRTVHLCTE